MQNWPLLRQTIEKMASIVVATGSNPAMVRSELVILAEREILAGRRAESAGIFSYLKSQPEDGSVNTLLARYADAIPAGAQQPWQSPVSVEVMSDCPPKP